MEVALTDVLHEIRIQQDSAYCLRGLKDLVGAAVALTLIH